MRAIKHQSNKSMFDTTINKMCNEWYKLWSDHLQILEVSLEDHDKYREIDLKDMPKNYYVKVVVEISKNGVKQTNELYFRDSIIKKIHAIKGPSAATALKEYVDRYNCIPHGLADAVNKNKNPIHKLVLDRLYEKWGAVVNKKEVIFKENI